MSSPFQVSTRTYKAVWPSGEIARFNTLYVHTYTVLMNVTLSIDEQTIARARKKAEALGKSLNQLIRDYLQKAGRWRRS
jgi:hypothetical protein